MEKVIMHGEKILYRSAIKILKIKRLDY
jgi:hypothetical protein